ncbi:MULTISPECIES: hypothetical protein [unclassified Gilliamella]|nr:MULTISPECIES: hypothetical protein [unclassified Gilliamella]MCX8601447.1 hypothetical protein [Gilliamella sp. B3722]MCX8607221.1 hypothetical protein [Gilliamella sp. B3771]MCX8610583.1 hypothetical protein [Gilliamella sp. B3891]MCX8613178.1 hypothetical protein [Gilliamella sp. B3773]MCX8615900.1 hypothetical protein [Gilliamella sp. B3770]
MTARQNTQNPCPSNALADLNDNTIIIDEWVNSENDYTVDRFGNRFQTKHKILNDLRHSVDQIQGRSFLPVSSAHTNENGVTVYVVSSHFVCTDWIGKWDLMPFRREELPFGWYPRNGDNYLLSSAQGQALNSLSANYKNDHRITIKNINGQQYINVPTAFAPDGRGFFERAVNGTTRQVGSIEGDAIRDIWGHFDASVVEQHDAYTRGAFKGTAAIYPENGATAPRKDWAAWGYDFRASNVVPTANENRPINVGLTPVIYLGV